LAFNIDLQRYGVDIPVFPENGRHYIGVNFDRPNDAVERLLDEPECLERIGEAGREWALKHYSPRAMAERFLVMNGFLTRPSAAPPMATV
jgi:glycosyltransferase involved in cell wall biosynthesis